MIQSTSKFKVKEIIYHKDHFVIATGYWNGGKQLSTACRWTGEEGEIGYPQTFGKPQWFLFPDATVNILDVTTGPKVQITFE